ncbi:hypothetical protein [Burkholderia anthina]|uniref:hypothetical protein n=1 Tax=Burkholderia anthina TaxID=179879 RepID=UPI00158EA69A|nr:hypothetical protein [Burkholderia anthina]
MKQPDTGWIGSHDLRSGLMNMRAMPDHAGALSGFAHHNECCIAIIGAQQRVAAPRCRIHILRGITSRAAKYRTLAARMSCSTKTSGATRPDRTSDTRAWQPIDVRMLHLHTRACGVACRLSIRAAI